MVIASILATHATEIASSVVLILLFVGAMLVCAGVLRARGHRHREIDEIVHRAREELLTVRRGNTPTWPRSPRT